MADIGGRLIGFAVLFAAILAVWSLMDKPEQTRPTSYDKGVYGGAEDQALDQDTINDLSHRALRLRSSGR